MPRMRRQIPDPVDGDDWGRAIAVIGTGRMGAALAGAALTARLDVTVWNRTAARVVPLVALGARSAPSVVEAIYDSDLIVVSLPDYGTSAALIDTDEAREALGKKCVVQLSTGTPGEAESSARRAAALDIAYIEGYPTSFHTQIGTDEAVLVYSGARDDFTRVRSVLSAFGTAVYLGEKPGLAKAALVASLPFYHGSMLGLLQGIAFAQAHGLSIAHFRDMMLSFVGTERDLIAGITERVTTGKFDDPLTSVTNQIGSSAMSVRACQDSNLGLALPAVLAAYFDRAGRDGLVHADVAAMLRYFCDGPDCDASILADACASIR